MTKAHVTQQYESAKEACPDSLLLFQVGDFYEMFHDDAKTAAKVLGLSLTVRREKDVPEVPMAGFPYHQKDAYVSKLVASGYRVAICDLIKGKINDTKTP